MHEQMRADLELSIRAQGGKHGILTFLRDKVPELHERRILVPSYVFGIREKFNARMMDLLEFACGFFGTDQIVVRSSEKNDLRGLIDAMSTKVGSLANILQIIELVKAECRDPLISAYSKQEGGYYDPEEVTLSVSPLVTMGPKMVLRMLVTEHPNLPGVSCVDSMYGGINHADGGNRFAFDFLYDRALFVDEYGRAEENAPNREALEADAREGLAVCNLVRRAGVLPTDRALQYELVKWKKDGKKTSPGEKAEGVFLTQVKFFADNNPTRCSPCEIQDVFDMENGRGFRNFGITPPGGLVLPLVRAEARAEFRKFEEKNPNVPYAAHLSIDGLTHPLSLRDPLPRMKAYLPDVKPSIDHQQSRPSMRALGNGGVALLNNPENCLEAKYVKIVADGLHSSVQEVMLA